MPKVQISRLQLVTLICNLVFSKIIGFTSGLLARRVGRDDWLAMSTAYVIGFVIMALMVWLAARFETSSPMAYVPRLLGRFLGKIALLGLAIFFFGSFMTSAITIHLHISDYLMTETPLIVFVLLYTLGCLYGAYLGIEVIARLALFGCLFAATIDFLMIIGSIQHLHITRLLPLFDSGVLPTVGASVYALPDVAMATAAAMLLLPQTGKRQGWLKHAWIGLALGAVTTLIWPVFEVGVLGPEVTAQFLISCMQLARASELSIYLHRYELIMVIVFAYSGIAQSLTCLYAACELTAAGLPFKVRRPVLMTVCTLLTIPLQYWLCVDRERYALFLAGPWPAIAISTGIGLPLLLCLVALFRRPGAPQQSGRPGRVPPWNPPSLPD